LALLSEIVREPAFAKEEIERARLETLDEIRLAMEEAGSVGRLAAVRATLATDSRPPSGTVASVSRILRKDIIAQHARLFSPPPPPRLSRPARCMLAPAGDIKSADAFALAEKLFGSWTASKVEVAKPPTEAPVVKPRVVVIDMPNAGQAAVYLAAPSITRQAD